MLKSSKRENGISQMAEVSKAMVIIGVMAGSDTVHANNFTRKVKPRDYYFSKTHGYR